MIIWHDIEYRIRKKKKIIKKELIINIDWQVKWSIENKYFHLLLILKVLKQQLTLMHHLVLKAK